eukprot:Skav205833  [mRNA]  locus=scaffold160:189305:190459:- [translate_table: standard]
MRRPGAAPAVAAVPAPRLLRDLQFGELQRLDFIVLKGAKYYGRSVDVGGHVKGVRLVERQLYLDIKVTGTRDDGFLRAISGLPTRMAQAHICEPACGAPLEGEFLLHAEAFDTVEKASEPWLSNLEEVVPEIGERDELEKLRAAARGDEGTPSGKEKKEKNKKEKKKDSKKKKEKEKKKKKKEQSPSKKEKKDLEEEVEKKKADRSSSSSSTGPEGPVGEKSLEAVFEGTGLDPDFRRRTRFLKKAKRVSKKLKKKKRKESEGSGSSQSSSSSEEPSQEGHLGLFEPEKRVKAIWRKCPGALTAHSLSEAKERLLTSSGALWSGDKQTLSPLFTYYARQNLMPTMSPPMAQETLTLGVALDLVLQGQVAGAADVMSQRLKALEV